MLPQRLLWLLLLALVASAHRSSRIRFHDNAYSGITVSLSEGVTASQREPLIKELQVSNRIRVERRSSLLLLCYCTAVAAAKTPVHSSLSLSLSLSLLSSSPFPRLRFPRSHGNRRTGCSHHNGCPCAARDCFRSSLLLLCVCRKAHFAAYYPMLSASASEFNEKRSASGTSFDSRRQPLLSEGRASDQANGPLIRVQSIRCYAILSLSL